MPVLTKTPSLSGLRYNAAPTRRSLTAGMRACAAWAAIEEHDKILDMACGGGALLRYLNGRYRLTLCGMCDSPEQARIVREEMTDADVVPASLSDIPWRNETFDIALLPSPPRSGALRPALEEACRVLKTGGQLVMAQSLLRMRGEGEGGLREAMRLMQEIGFREVTLRLNGLTAVALGWKK